MTESKVEDYFHRCPIKNLCPEERPIERLPIEDQILFMKIRLAMHERNWDMEWLQIDLDKHVLNVDHPSISKEQAVAFYNEIFSQVKPEILDYDEEGKEIIKELAALEALKREEKDRG